MQVFNTITDPVKQSAINVVTEVVMLPEEKTFTPDTRFDLEQIETAQNGRAGTILAARAEGNIENPDVARLKQQLSRVITPSVKNRLEKLVEFSNAEKNPDDPDYQKLEQEAIDAYRNLSGELKVSLGTILTHKAILIVLSDTPAEPYSETIANIAAEPLTRGFIAVENKRNELEIKLLNKMLKKMGKEEITPGHHDAFMARMAGKIAGPILNELEKDSLSNSRNTHTTAIGR